MIWSGGKSQNLQATCLAKANSVWLCPRNVTNSGIFIFSDPLEKIFQVCFKYQVYQLSF